MRRQTKSQLIASLDSFTRAYIEAMLWSTTDESTPSGGEPMDENYGVSDIERKTLERIIKDCADFQNEHSTVFDGAHKPSQYSDNELAGHDFWLTRNGHGCGFWDGDWREPAATTLTDASKQAGELWPYIYRGKVYL